MATNSQLNLPPRLLTNSSRDEVVRTKSSERGEPRTIGSREDAQRDSSLMFDAAIDNAELTSGEVSFLLGVSESLVNRMRSPNYREGVSLAQLFLLPAAFHWEVIKLLVSRIGLFERAVLDAFISIGRLAFGVKR